MRAIRLFTQQTLTIDTTITLEDGPAHHLARVLRAKPGDAVVLFNGDGFDVSGQVVSIERREVAVRLSSRSPVDNQSPLGTHLGLCLSKGDRFDWALQKATELGVHRITPLFSERTEVRLSGERLTKKRLHWQGIVISACEQCHRGRIPEIAVPLSLDHWVGTVEADLKLVLHHHRSAALPSVQPLSAALLIGPEGGLTEAEVTTAETHRFARWCIGPRVLRTETAPLAALSVLGSRWGDLSP